MKLFRSIKSRFSNRPDTEHQQALIRLLVGAVTTLYFAPTAFRLEYWALLVGQAIFVIYILFMPIWIYLDPGISAIRRYVGAFGDMVALTAAMIFLGDSGLSIYALFIWVTTANGYRFGSNYLLFALILGILGLATVWAVSPAMHGKASFGFELIVVYAVLCLYVNSLVKKLYDSVSKANQASDAKRQFLSKMSHDLRTPLHIIAGIADMMKRSKSTQQLAELHGSLEAAVNSMLRLVNDILDFSKIEAGKIEVSMGRLNLYQAMAETAKLFAPASLEKSIKLNFFIDANVPSRLIGDAPHLHQALNNLLSNAIKFTEQGHVSVSVHCISVVRDIATIEWRIEDSGIGIPKDKQDQIFESFTQADATVAMKYGGTGLGTTIARELIQLMGGKIGFISEVGKGTTFWFWLPLRLNTDQPNDPTNIRPNPVFALGYHTDSNHSFSVSVRAAVKNKQIEEWEIAEMIASSETPSFGLLAKLHVGELPHLALAAIKKNIPVIAVEDHPITPEMREDLRTRGVLSVLESLASIPAAIELLQNWTQYHLHTQELARSGPSLRIVVADDDNTNLKIISTVLQRGGHQVVQCTNGEEVLDVLLNEDSDLVVMDMNMPILDGLSTTKMIRSLPNPLGNIPIALLTADATSSSRNEASEAKVTAFLTKPIKPDALLMEIARIVSEKRVEAQPQAEVKDILHPIPEILDEEVIKQLKMLSKDNNFLPEIIRQYLSEAQIRMQALHDSVSKNDYTKWRNELHRFQGGSASLGLRRLVSVLDQSRSIAPDSLGVNGYRAINKIRKELSAAEAALLAVD